MREVPDTLKSPQTNAAAEDCNGYMSIRPVLNQLVERIEKRYENGEATFEVPTGFDSLDKIIGGFRAGELALFVGRPSHDKAILVRNIIEHATLTQRFPTAVFTQGIPADKLVTEMMSSVGGIPYQRLERVNLMDEEWPRLATIARRISDAPILVNDIAGLKIKKIRSICHRIRRNHGLGLVVMMSVQRVDCTQTREDATTRKARKLKALALDLDVPVLALSELSRAGKPHRNGWPHPTLRDISDYEQQADVVISTYRSVENDADSTMTTEVAVAKPPCGLTGRALLFLQPELARFSSERRQESVMD